VVKNERNGGQEGEGARRKRMVKNLTKAEQWS
jgi:hypothetical protein